MPEETEETEEVDPEGKHFSVMGCGGLTYSMPVMLSMPHDEIFDSGRNPRDYTHAKMRASAYRQWLERSKAETEKAEKELSDLDIRGLHDWILMNLERAEIEITGWKEKPKGAWETVIKAEKEQQAQALLAVLRIGIAAMARQEAESHLDWFENHEKHAEADEKARESRWEI